MTQPNAAARNTAEFESRIALAQAAASEERSLWALADSLNPELSNKLRSQGASVQQVLTAVHGVRASMPQQQPQHQNPQPQPGGQAQWDQFMAQARGEPAPSGDGSIAAFGGYLGDAFAQEHARGAAAAKSILAKVCLTG